MTQLAETRSDVGRRRTLGVSASAAFALLVVGSNIPGPLLPLYAEILDLSTFTVSALFAAYLVALVVTFTVMARTRLARFARVLLPSAILVAVAGDLALLAGADSVEYLFLGRLLTGTCVGIATGATATIVVVARGEKGRTIAASGAILGSFVGLILSAVVAEYLPGPTSTVYLIHIALLTTIAVILLLSLYSARRLLSDALAAPVGDDSTAMVSMPARLRLAGYGIGLAGWAIGGIAVGILPTAVREQTGSVSLIVGALAPVVLLGVACLSPLAFNASTVSMKPVHSLILIACGAVSCALGTVWGSLVLVVLGCVCWGLGQGFAYACGLRILTRGLSAVEQGRTASRFASFCYGLTAVLALVTGAACTRWGTAVGMSIAGTAFVVLCTTVGVLGYGRWVTPTPEDTITASGAV